MLVIGLTGGIGTGKSTVAAQLASLGAAVIDADQLVHEGYAQDEPLRRAIVDAFGMDVLNADGRIDRRTLGQRVFQQPEALQRLNGIVHPWVYGRIQERLAALDAAGTAVVVLEVPLLLETGHRSLADTVWVTDASPETVTERLQQSRGLTPEQVAKRIQSQLSPEERRRAADVVIDTNGSPEEVRQQVAHAWATIQRTAPEPRRVE